MKKTHKLIYFSIMLSIFLSQCSVLFSGDSTIQNTNSSEVVFDDNNLKISDIKFKLKKRFKIKELDY